MPRKRQDHEFDRVLGAVIKERRKASKRTMRQLVDDAGLDITEATMWGIEAGDQRLSAYQLFRLASSLQISVDDFFAKIESPFGASIEFIHSAGKNEREKF